MNKKHALRRSLTKSIKSTPVVGKVKADLDQLQDLAASLSDVEDAVDNVEATMSWTESLGFTSYLDKIARLQSQLSDAVQMAIDAVEEKIVETEESEESTEE